MVALQAPALLPCHRESREKYSCICLKGYRRRGFSAFGLRPKPHHRPSTGPELLLSGSPPGGGRRQARRPARICRLPARRAGETASAVKTTSPRASCATKLSSRIRASPNKGEVLYAPFEEQRHALRASNILAQSNHPHSAQRRATRAPAPLGGEEASPLTLSRTATWRR